jgi:hypothetical protein
MRAAVDIQAAASTNALSAIMLKCNWFFPFNYKLAV